MSSIFNLAEDIQPILKHVVLKKDWKRFSCKRIRTKCNFNYSCIVIQRLDRIGEYTFYNIFNLLRINGAIKWRFWWSKF